MEETAPDPLQAHGGTGVGLVPALTLVHHPDPRSIGRRFVVDGTLALGRGGDALGDGILDDDLLSRRHAEVIRQGSIVSVRDLGSRNGTCVDGVRVEKAALGRGNVLSVGSLVFVLGWAPRSFTPPNDPLLCGISFALGRLLEDVRSVAAEDTTVLVRGETGTGKELVARRLHELSGRKGSFVAVNCGGVPDSLLASELFGHVAGAFSGAAKDRVGLVEAAGAGTLLLDEIGDASPPLQVSLLRLLEDHEYRQVGSSSVRRADARVVAATHVRLDDAVEQGRFRRDLLARLRRWTLDVPALRERKEDIIPIARRVAVERLGAEASIDRALSLALLLHDWPDNVRGLRAVVEAAAVEADQKTLRLSSRVQAQLDERASRPRQTEPRSNQVDAPIAYKQRKPDAQTLLRRLAELDGNVKVLATELGVARNTLYRWFHAAGIDPGNVRSK
jgi:transcriptional regulator with PAS, ATPase and Fis domain